MVFESVLTQVLNRFLGAYVENLDTNQLRVGIWGGDVELNDLVLKQSALDDLDLPVQTTYGKIGKLVLKIPWKNLYGAAFIINVEDIYLLAAPNQQVSYNEEKELAKEKDAKQKEILKVELAKKQEADRDKPKADYTFVEKLVTQIIKNIQLNIKNIHIRYEDKVTSPKPFSLGITLSELNVVSTDEFWKPAITKEDITKIYKIVALDGLAVYWNSDSEVYESLAGVNLVDKMCKEIASKVQKPEYYKYILGPINASARLRINQKPEIDTPAFTIPKIHLNLDMERLFIGISKAQYRDIIALADSMDRMSKGIPYRKFRPSVDGYKGHYKDWWHFAYTAVLEGEVKRRRRNWDWNHISKHRETCKEYGLLYEKKLENKASSVELDRIEECERTMDVFNIVIIRQRVEFEHERRLKDTKKQDKGWFSWAWGSKSSQTSMTSSSSTAELKKQFQEAMTKEEKERLFKAIGYQENALPSQFPEEYIDNSCTFLLRTLELELSDDDAEQQRIILTELKGVRCRLDTRSAAQALKINVRIDELTSFGLQQEDFLPQLITSETAQGDTSLLEVTFETNPLDKKCGQRLYLTSQPLKVVYDGETVVKAVEIFKVPSSTALDQLSAVAGDGLTNFKEMSSTGLQHAIDSHVHFDLNIDLRAPYVIIPYGGKYTGGENALVCNFGNLRMHSLDRTSVMDLREMHSTGYSEAQIRQQLIEQSYDRFILELTHVQIMMAQSDEDWNQFLKKTDTSSMHLLEPLNLKMNIEKCMISDDPSLPLVKLSGKLAKVAVNASDARLLLLTALVQSIPLPTSDVPEPLPIEFAKKVSSVSLMRFLEVPIEKERKEGKKDTTRDKYAQFTTLEVDFVMSELTLDIKHQDTIKSPLEDVATFCVKNLSLDVQQQTFNIKVALKLAGIGFTQNYNNSELKVITSPAFEGSEDQYLFEINYVQVDKKSPEIHSVYKSCESSLGLKFSKLGVLLHKEAILALMQFATSLQTDINDAIGEERKDRIATADVKSTTSIQSRKSSTAVSSLYPPVERKKKSHRILIETVKFKLTASVAEVNVEFQNKNERISSCALIGVRSEVIIKESHTQINAFLSKIAVADLNPDTCHPMILAVEGNEALDAKVVLYNLEENVESDSSDMSVFVTMGGLRIIFVNLFVSRMLEFLNEFQAAQAVIIEASQAAAQSAKENMQNVYAKATKISLSVDLKAPDIIMPEHSKSYDAILLDLGHIAISNQFVTLEIKNEKNFSAVIDELKVSLTETKMSRIKLDENDKITKELPLLIPVTFKLTIKRNLSSSWYKAVPDIDIVGRIFSITLMMSHTDYRTVMSILNKNLTEGQTTPKPTVQPVKESVSTKAIIERVDEVKDAEKETKVNTMLRFNFVMDNLVVTLFTGGSETLVAESHSERDSLGKFSLEGLGIKLRMLSDDSIIASVLLLNCLLDDMREGREDKLNRLLQRSSSSEASSLISVTESEQQVKSMLDIMVRMKGPEIFAEVRVYSFKLILSVDYMMKLLEFVTIPEEKQETVVTAKTSMAAQRSSMNVVEAPNQQITLNLKIEKPDIVLVEHMDSPDTQALVLNSEVLVKLRMSGAHQVINGTIKDLQLFTSNYNQMQIVEHRKQVLDPVTISLAGSTPQDKGLHVELLITDVVLRVSPAIIELLSRVSATATGADAASTSDENEVSDLCHVWDCKPFKEQDYWFFKTEDAVEATEQSDVIPVVGNKEELCIVSIPSITVTMEAGVGSKTLPMLIIETSLKSNVNNWSSHLSIEAGLTLQMKYYNSRLALWEPLIEPVEVMKQDRMKMLPWELKVEVSMNEKEEVTTPNENESIDAQSALMCIDVTSDHSMEIVVTKTCLEVLNNLGKAFASALKTEKPASVETLAPYKLVNQLGNKVAVNLDKGSFSLFNNENAREVILENDAEVALVKKGEVSALGKVGSDEEVTKEYFVNIKVVDKNCELELPVMRADKRYFPLNYRGEGNDAWGLISDIKVDEGMTIITLRSILQVYNHFNIPIEVYYMTPRGNELASVATVKPDSHVDIPLKAVYTQTNELFFSVHGYSVTSTPYVWKDLLTNLTVKRTLKCQPKDMEFGDEPFIIQAVGDMEQVYFENTTRHTMSSTCYNIHLRPAVIFKNYLPIDVVCCIENIAGEMLVEPGKTLNLSNVEPGKSAMVLRLPSYLEKEWSCREELLKEPTEFSVWNFNSYDSSAQMSLTLGMHVLNTTGSTVMTLYCPFWLLNKTGLTLSYRKSKKSDSSGTPSKSSDENANVLHHPADFKGPILFSFNAKNFFGKKKAAVRVEHGEWSDKFSLDVAGSSGVIACKFGDMLYQIGVCNQLTLSGLTKQVTFTPYYVIINNANFPIECQENDRPGDAWLVVQGNSCSALWPKSELDDKLLRLRVKETKEVSAPFLYTESHTSLLKLQNKYGGVNVDIQISEGAIYISLAPFDSGAAPALIINHTENTMNFWEKESVQIRKIPAKQCMLYTWENPSGPRTLMWEGAKRKEHSHNLKRDDIGEYELKEDCRLYWVSFLDGMQRILLFTHDQFVAQNAKAANLFEVFQQEINVSIYGLGLSLVNNQTRQEVMYMAMASSGIIWEQCKMTGKRFKHFSNKDSLMLEAAYQRYLSELEQGFVPRTTIDAKTEVDFRQNLMLRPNKRKIRRTFENGLWLQMRTSPSQLQLHAKINKLQIDNQMYDCIFPVVLAPVPLPKTVAIDSGIKPFAELSIVQLLLKNSQVKQFKYFKLLVQEFHIKVDLGFVNALCEVVQSAEYTEEEERQMFMNAVQLVDKQLFDVVSSQSLQEQKSFYDLLHFSPLKIHVSFSIAAGSSATSSGSTPNFLNVLLQGLGVTLTDLQDVIFRLAYFERECTFLTQRQLINEATGHYVGQAVRQLYVLVLGLDVLGNPYGLIRGITQGVEDFFYEPFQGAIQGPGEFAEGLVLGVRSLFGHTVGGAAGAVSRITGAMGKGIAVLTFDKDYQRKRRDQINKKPATVQEGIARSGKGLVMGVVDGVTGVFTKPISGAKEEGVGGFFKGLGKGAVGLVARPTAGVIDFASGSLDAVKRVTEIGEDANRLRPPRFLPADGLVKPYNKHEAFGHKLLTELEKGKYATTDVYDSHFPIIEKREVLLLTDKRLAFITHNDLFGGWQVEWAYTWPELKQPASVVPKGVSIVTAEKRKKMSLLGSNDSTKIILIADPARKEELCAKIEKLRGGDS